MHRLPRGSLGVSVGDGVDIGEVYRKSGRTIGTIKKRECVDNEGLKNKRQKKDRTEIEREEKIGGRKREEKVERRRREEKRQKRPKRKKRGGDLRSSAYPNCWYGNHT